MAPLCVVASLTNGACNLMVFYCDSRPQVATADNAETVMTLLDMGASPDGPTNASYTALMLTACPRTAMMLIDRSADLDARTTRAAHFDFSLSPLPPYFFFLFFLLFSLFLHFVPCRMLNLELAIDAMFRNVRFTFRIGLHWHAWGSTKHVWGLEYQACMTAPHSHFGATETVEALLNKGEIIK